MEHTVLCVDDEENILSALRRVLRREPYALLTAASAAEGLALLERRPAHLVVADQRMPGMTGVQFLRRVKQDHPDTVRVILSGYAEAGLILEALNQGEVYRFLTKPWEDEDLKQALRQCLAHHDLLLQNRMLLEEVRVRNEALARFNTQLAHMVEERTRSLGMSQEVMAAVPIPILGVGPTGMIVLVNPAAEAAFPAACRGAIGEDLSTRFPPALAEKVRGFLKGPHDRERLETELEGRALRIHLRALRDGEEGRGCAMVLEEA